MGCYFEHLVPLTTLNGPKLLFRMAVYEVEVDGGKKWNSLCFAQRTFSNRITHNCCSSRFSAYDKNRFQFEILTKQIGWMCDISLFCISTATEKKSSENSSAFLFKHMLSQHSNITGYHIMFSWVNNQCKTGVKMTHTDQKFIIIKQALLTHSLKHNFTRVNKKIKTIRG